MSLNIYSTKLQHSIDKYVTQANLLNELQSHLTDYFSAIDANLKIF